MLGWKWRGWVFGGVFFETIMQTTEHQSLLPLLLERHMTIGQGVSCLS